MHRKRCKDNLKDILKNIYIDVETWDKHALDRQIWKSLISISVKYFENSRTEYAQQKRPGRHMCVNPLKESGSKMSLTCDQCDRI